VEIEEGMKSFEMTFPNQTVHQKKPPTIFENRGGSLIVYRISGLSIFHTL